MLDLPAPFSSARIKSDILEIEQLGELIGQLQIQTDSYLAQTFQKLLDSVGSKEFYPLYSKIYQFVIELKWAREGMWETGYVVPWVSLYSCLGGSGQLVSVANRFSQRNISDNMSYNGAISFPTNNFGVGSVPVDIDQKSWHNLLQELMGDKREHFSGGVFGQNYRSKRHFRVYQGPYRKSNQVNELPTENLSVPGRPQKESKEKHKRAAPYSKSKLIASYIKNHAAKAAGPDITK